MFIDPHVHARDFGECHKETIDHILKVAEIAGMTAIAAMPNTNPPLTTYEHACAYLQKAHACTSPVKFLVYLGLTNDSEQVKRVPEAIRELEKQFGRCVMGIKQYCAHSTGNMGVIDEDQQLLNLDILTREGYKDVFVAHAEKHSLMDDSRFDPQRPRSWAEYCRPPESEVASVKDQIEFAKTVGFNGTLHIAHISVPESVYLVRDARKAGLNVTCGVTPQHLRLDWIALDGEHGIQRKMNPPLRPVGARVAMLEGLRNGDIDLIETDHAPHTLAEKTGKILDATGKPIYLSGMLGLPRYAACIDWLRKGPYGKGSEFSEPRIKDITFNHANEIFKLNLTPRECTPRTCVEEYAYDSYAGV